MGVIETTCTYNRKNLFEMEHFLHSRTRKRLLLLTLAGLALLAAGVIFNIPYCIYLGVIWTIFFLAYSDHTARKSAKSTLKHNQKIYGCEVTVQTKFYHSMLMAENLQSEKKLQCRYDEVKRLIVTRNLYVLVLQDNVAIMVDRRPLGREKDGELYELLTTGCIHATYSEAK